MATRFAMCRGRHLDPAYEFHGTIDGAILDLDDKKLFLYTATYSGKKFLHLELGICVDADSFLVKFPPTAEGLRTVMELAASDLAIKLECYPDLQQDELLRIVAADIAPAPMQAKRRLLAELHNCLQLEA